MAEIREPYGFIYITTNMVNGKKYIGQKKLDSKWKNYLGSGKAFKRAIKKYGGENFHRDIVAIAYSKEELDNLEIEFIELHNAVKSEDYYNIKTGGGSGNPYAGKTEEEIEGIKKKLSEIQLGEKHHQATKVICTTTGRVFDYIKQGAEFYGCWHTGITQCCRGKRKSNGSFNGKPLKWMYYSDYVNLTEEEREKVLFDFSGTNNFKKVICITTGIVFDSIKEACKYYEIKNNSGIIRNCKKESRYCGKLTDGTKLVWRYYEDYLKMSKEEAGQAIEKRNETVKPKSKKVICITTGKIFNTFKEAGEFYNCNPGNIGMCCKGKRKLCGNLKWAYYDELTEVKEVA